MQSRCVAGFAAIAIGMLCAAVRAENAPVPEARVPEAIERKAEVLEQNAAADGEKAAPPPAELIRQPEVQRVDPTGEAPLDDVITCLARTIYWEARGDG